MATATRAAAAYLLLLLAIVLSALASRDMGATAGTRSGLPIVPATAGFALGRASQGRSLHGYDFVKKSPKKQVVEVVKKSAPSPPPPAKKVIEVQKKSPSKHHNVVYVDG